MRAFLRITVFSILFALLVIFTILSPKISNLINSSAASIEPKPITAAIIVTTPDGIRWIPIYGMRKGYDQMYFHQESMQIQMVDGTRHVIVKFLDPNPDASKHESTGYLMAIDCQKKHVFWVKKFTFNVAFPGENNPPITGETNDPNDLKDDMEISKSMPFYNLFCSDTV